jgi:hypothetical protein
MSVEATVESPANQPLATHTLKSFAPFEVITLSNSQAPIQNRAKAVDAVFDGFTRSFNHDDSAARLLNLELNRNARLAGASHSNGQNDLQARSAELCGDCDAADESLTSDFHQFRYGPALESVVRR